jgi:tetrachlorobenzoquinone reductase
VSPTADPLHEMQVKSISFEARGVLGFDLRPTNLQPLPQFTPGAHIDLHLQNGLIRSYSLVNPPTERHRYVIAVGRDAASRGGSKYLHESIRCGDVVSAAGPRNNFPLQEDATDSVFIAGGIGITPIFAMVQRLAALGRRWQLYYCARTRKSAAYVSELSALGKDQVRFNFDGEDGGQVLDVDAVVSASPAGSHFYCCGPTGMLSAFERATARIAPERVHLEYFAPVLPAATEGGFAVELARSSRTVFVPPGRSILDVLIEAGVDLSFSCAEGICGTCETRVLSGTPDHRDLVLTAQEKASNRKMMICCSGCKGDKLVLDL